MIKSSEKVEIVSTKRLILLGQAVLDLVIAGATCPLCKRDGGEHGPDCRAGEAVINDAVVRRQVQEARRG